MENSVLFSVNNQLLETVDEAHQLTKAEEQRILSETSKFSLHFLKEVCKDAAKKSVSCLVQSLQFVMYYLLEKIQNKQDRNRNHFREKLATQLTSFLHFMQKQCGSFFNTDATMPRYMWQPIHEELHPYLYKGKNFLLEQTETALINIIQQVYELTTSQPAPSYRQAAYWQQLTESFRLNNLQPNHNHTKTVYCLLRFNFNHPLFTQYVLNCYIQGAALAPCITTHWKETFQHINRVIPEAGLRLLTDERGCKRKLLFLIGNELRASQFSKEAETFMQKKIPIQYNLSVAQLAVALRMQIESGMIETNNVSELLRYFSEQMVTRKGSPISIKNLYNNYHEPERAAINILLDYNTRMRNILLGLLNG